MPGVDINKEMKADLNISLGDDRVEIKNVTGIKNLVDAERFEVKRQSELLAHNQKIPKETRSYNAETLSTVSSREKESDEEYGFIYEPDLAAYPTSEIILPDVVIASEVARSLSSKYGVNEVTLKELVMFDSHALGLIQYGLQRSKASTVINAIELLKRHGSITIQKEGFGKMLEYLDKGLLLNEDAITALQENKLIEIEKNSVSTEEIDREILAMVKQRPDLVKEYRTNGKAFNFMVGIILKSTRSIRSTYRRGWPRSLRIRSGERVPRPIAYFDICSSLSFDADGPANDTRPAINPVAPMTANPEKNPKPATRRGSASAPMAPPYMSYAIAQRESGCSCAGRVALSSERVCDLKIEPQRKRCQEGADDYHHVTGKSAYHKHSNQPHYC